MTHRHRTHARRAAGALLGALALAAPLWAGSHSAAATTPTAQPTENSRNLIKNGTFATPQVPNLTKAWWNGTFAQSRMTGWQPIEPGWYDLLNAKFAEHPDGHQAVDLGQEFLPNGGVRQTIDTEAGATYTLTFDHSPDAWGNCIGYPTDFSVAVIDEASGEELTRRGFQAAPADGRPHWKSGKVTFVAAGAETTVAFRGNASVSCQAAVTDVRVPKSDSIPGG